MFSPTLNSVSEGTKRYDGARTEEEMLKFVARFIEDRVTSSKLQDHQYFGFLENVILEDG